MKVNKMKIMSTIGALGLTAGVLAGCGSAEEENEEYVKAVDQEGNTVYVEEDAFDDDGNSMFFLPFFMWSGNNHSGLKPASGYKGTVSKTKPTPKSKSRTGGSGSGVGKTKGGSSAKSGGFGG